MAGAQDEASSVIDTFVRGWPEEIEKYEKLSKCAEAICTKKLEINRIRHTIKSRPKAQKNLEDSIRRRQKRRPEPYKNRDEIKHDMIDLAGVRIALTFPNDKDKVRKIIQETFDPYLNPWDDISCPDLERSVIDRSGIKRNRGNGSDEEWPLGLKSLHLRCKLKESDEQFSEYKGLAVEIQVGTGFMYAWEDVYHDIVYKPYFGRITPEEERFIEILNGLAHTGELALKQLSASLTLRTELENKPFKSLNHFKEWLRKALLLEDGVGLDSRFYNTRCLYHVLPLLNLNMPSDLWPVIVSSRDDIVRSRDILNMLSYGRDIWWDSNPITNMNTRQEVLLLVMMHVNARGLIYRRYRINPYPVDLMRRDVSAFFLQVFGTHGRVNHSLASETVISSTELFDCWRRRLDLSLWAMPMERMSFVLLYELAFEIACRGRIFYDPDHTPPHVFNGANRSDINQIWEFFNAGCANMIRGLKLEDEKEDEKTGWYRFDWDKLLELNDSHPVFDYDVLQSFDSLCLMISVINSESLSHSDIDLESLLLM
ncbi:hypothetical protein F5Y00DRAFT_259409 [Daldinia vernicosa]|uniref:uncharacterized protein n=1 Tax=Daldinia vernicosa TaxID=114800 RepID=UPI002007D87A|nr:uncharacterized protein F5Y00DRAFT_259409 [Daldinia vernicosa]KAI0851400.1 hypothetical protein F5Y00DRAFT_259409 [Daldinia vernicosa]